jgi:serine/threonine-protein phosphatase 6 regulatory ankyrin repeat subunit A/serine/threonine-protein phosphatase 6 regulatory ankyrin repeat subunit B
MKRCLLLLTLFLSIALVAEEADINERRYDGDTPLIDAVKGNDAKEVERCLKRKANVNLGDARGETPLMLSVYLKEDVGRSLMKRLIKAKADVNAVDLAGETALMKAAMEGALDALDILIAAGADIDKTRLDGRTALMLAITSGKHKSAARLILAKATGVFSDEDGITALMLSADSQFARGCGMAYPQFLQTLAAVSDVNAADKNGRTTLFYAAENDNRELASLLIARGADANHVDVNGDTAILAAARAGNDHIVKQLISAKANLDARDRTGRSALMLLCARGDFSIGCAWLQQAGANIDQQDNDGRTALIHAARIGDPRVVSALLTYGANPALKDKSGATALDYAYARMAVNKAEVDKQCYELLRRAGKP